MEKTTTYKGSFDKLSMLVTGLCLVHCIVLPALLTTLPLWGIELIENKNVELAVVLLAFVTGGWAVWRGYQKFHRKAVVPVLFLAGIALMIIAGFLNDETGELVSKAAGAVLVVTAHVLNWMWARRCADC